MTWGPRPLSTFLSELCAARDEGRQRGLDYGFPEHGSAEQRAALRGAAKSPLVGEPRHSLLYGQH
jgi:hypothetical protein